MHRITWIAIPVVGLIAIGSGVGYWSHSVQTERQALAAQAESQYAGAFHGLVSDMDHLTEKLGQAEISTDGAAFESDARDIWRLAYEAQTAIGRLPIELMPMHRTQTYLAGLTEQSSAWMDHPELMRQAAVQKEIRRYYTQSKTLSGQLSGVQDKVLSEGLGWLAVNHAIAQNKKTGDNQVVDGFRKMDSQVASFANGGDIGAHVEGPNRKIKATGPRITGTTAIQTVAQWLGVKASKDWKFTSSTLGGQTSVFIVTGEVGGGNLRSTVTQHGGHVLNLSLNHAGTSDNFGFGEAEDKAMALLAKQGFGKTDVEIANQYDHTGYFVLVPWRSGGWAIDAPITVKIALDSGQLMGLDFGAYYKNNGPYTVPKRVYTAAALEKKLNPSFQVKTTRPVTLKGKDGQMRPGIEFFGTSTDETYAIILDAVTGQQLRIQHLT